MSKLRETAEEWIELLHKDRVPLPKCTGVKREYSGKFVYDDQFNQHVD